MSLRSVLLRTSCAVFVVTGAPCVRAETGQIRGAGIKAYEENMPPRRDPIRHLLYIATPGDKGESGQSGIVVLDADHDYRFLKRISWELPASEMPGEEVTGITASVPENMLYVTQSGSITAFDLATDKVVWTFKGEPGGVARHFRYASNSGCCERPWALPDGETLLVGSSYNSWWYYIDAHTGAIKGKVMTPHTPIAHNVVVTPDGKTAFLSSLTGPSQNMASVSVVDVSARKVLNTITFSDIVRPETINHDGSLLYANVNALDGFEIADVKTGKVINRLELPGDLWKAKWADPNNHYFGHGAPSHGIGMTPDESEIWVTDIVNNAWQVWDNPGDGRNPIYNPSKTVPVTPNVDSSWIDMTNDGKLAFAGDGSIIDVKEHKVIAMMKDEYGHPIRAAEKVLYMALQDGKLIETNNQFAVGLHGAGK